jgi:hypothetical protein
MAVQHDYTLSVNRNGANVVQKAWSRAEELEVNYDNSLGVVADQATGIALTIANVRSLVIVADQDCTLKTNSTGTPQETLALKANVPVVWDANMPGFAIGELFAGNVTNVYVTTTVATRLQWYTVINA